MCLSTIPPWTVGASLSPLKVGLGSVGVTGLDGKIHAVGGRTPAGDTVTTHQVYDPAINSWSERAPLPKARDHMALVAADGKIHAIGGRFGASNDMTDLHDIYDPASNSWTSGPPLPTARSGLAATLYRRHGAGVGRRARAQYLR